ncbi:hypothetical protein HJG52_13455 [Knoellia sp. DB2414S]|uniref:DsrE/DsrF-like family protein n=2 Tax=Knoellia koreensis TaxID=2730921 RepID=A0A849HII2_9MICO|nr:hypothetical protein [Knoellia sp. DB2414S]
MSTATTRAEDEVGVVIHLDEDTSGKFEAVLRNVGHLLDELDRSPVELVAHGPGVAVMLRSNPHAGTVQDLRDRGLSLVACGNTLARMDIAPQELAPGVSVASSGLGQLVRRQRQGWSYVRP